MPTRCGRLPGTRAGRSECSATRRPLNPLHEQATVSLGLIERRDRAGARGRVLDWSRHWDGGGACSLGSPRRRYRDSSWWRRRADSGCGPTPAAFRVPAVRTSAARRSRGGSEAAYRDVDAMDDGRPDAADQRPGVDLCQSPCGALDLGIDWSGCQPPFCSAGKDLPRTDVLLPRQSRGQSPAVRGSPCRTHHMAWRRSAWAWPRSCGSPRRTFCSMPIELLIKRAQNTGHSESDSRKRAGHPC